MSMSYKFSTTKENLHMLNYIIGRYQVPECTRMATQTYPFDRTLQTFNLNDSHRHSLKMRTIEKAYICLVLRGELSLGPREKA